MEQRDCYRSTGCYDTRCPGFESASGSGIAPGVVIDPVSQVHGQRQKLTIKVLLVINHVTSHTHKIINPQ
jgi:hypothetical protein